MKKCPLLILVLSIAIAGNGAAQETPDKGKPTVLKQKIKMVEGLRFEPARFAVKNQDRVELTLENHDPNDQPHNLVLIKPGTLEAIQQASMQIGPESVARGFVPEHDAIIVASGLLNPDGKEKLSFDVPDEDGVYYYVCTFPGHATVMYGALYVNTKWADSLPYDPNIPEIVRNAELEKTKALVEVERPTFARLFMPDAGPAAMAVALTDAQNICWDAGACRLRYAWSGGFIDPTRLFNSNGNALPKLLGDVYWRSRDGETTYGVQFGDSPAKSVDFKGYRVIDGLPEFHYLVGGVSVREYLSTSADGGLQWRFQIEDAPGDVRVLAPIAEGVSISGSKGQRDQDFWLVPRQDSAEFSLQINKP